MTGVLQPGVTVAQANAELAGLSDVEVGTGGFHVVGRPVEKGCCGSKWMSITPGYLSLFKIPVLRGRDFTDSDNARAPAVALINEAFAREFFPHQDPIGQHIDHGQGGIQTIIGIVADFHDGGLATPANRREISIHLRHAADAVLLDDFGYVVLIIRKHNPGAGLKALPGGFMDPVRGIDGAIVAEKAATAALREAAEETGISKRLLEGAHIIPLGHRSYNRVLTGDQSSTAL